MPYASVKTNSGSSPITIKKKIELNDNFDKIELNHNNASDILYSNNCDIPPDKPFVFTPPDKDYMKVLYLNYISSMDSPKTYNQRNFNF